MENIEKENKRLKVLIVILTLVLLGLGVYHYYVTYINVDKSDDNDVVENSATEKEDTWVNYLLHTDDLKVILTKANYVDANGNAITKEDQKTLTNSEIKEYLEKLYLCDVERIMYAGGLGGPEFYRADITYSLNGQTIHFNLSYGNMFEPNYRKNVDDYLIYLLSKNAKKVVMEENDTISHYQIFSFNGKCSGDAIDNFFE